MPYFSGMNKVNNETVFLFMYNSVANVVSLTKLEEILGSLNLISKDAGLPTLKMHGILRSEKVK